MPNIKLSREVKNFLILVGIFILSLGAAVILFYLLDSFAQIQQKGIKIGGAGAGFVIIFFILRDTYFRIASEEIKTKGISTDEKISKLEAEIERLTVSKLNNFIVPNGYKQEISEEFQFGFCYPEGWQFVKFPEETLYGFVKDFNSFEKIGFARNVNVIISDISIQGNNLNALFESGLDSVLELMPNAKMIFKEDLLFQGLPAMKYRVDYVTNSGQQLTVYQFLVASKDRKYLYTISFTTTQEDFNSSKVLFDNIASTFRI